MGLGVFNKGAGHHHRRLLLFFIIINFGNKTTAIAGRRATWVMGFWVYKGPDGLGTPLFFHVLGLGWFSALAQLWDGMIHEDMMGFGTTGWRRGARSFSIIPARPAHRRCLFGTTNRLFLRLGRLPTPHSPRRTSRPPQLHQTPFAHCHLEFRRSATPLFYERSPVQRRGDNARPQLCSPNQPHHICIFGMTGSRTKNVFPTFYYIYTTFCNERTEGLAQPNNNQPPITWGAEDGGTKKAHTQNRKPQTWRPWWPFLLLARSVWGMGFTTSSFFIFISAVTCRLGMTGPILVAQGELYWSSTGPVLWVGGAG